MGYRRSLIRLFVNKIFLYDDKYTITFNSGDEEVTITDLLLSKIEKGSEAENLCLSDHVAHQRKSPQIPITTVFVGFLHLHCKKDNSKQVKKRYAIK